MDISVDEKVIQDVQQGVIEHVMEQDEACDIMKYGAELASETMKIGAGGPFGAVIVRGREVISIASNSVLSDHDPTAHAEVNAIRWACRTLGTHDLSGCTIYATGEPCPMCLSAIMWANIKEVYVSGLAEDAAEIGFRDDFMYKFIESKCTDESVLKMHYINRDIAKHLYKEYANMSGTMY